MTKSRKARLEISAVLYKKGLVRLGQKKIASVSYDLSKEDFKNRTVLELIITEILNAISEGVK